MRHLRRLCVTTSLVLAACASYSASSAMAENQSPSFAPICAEREVQVITMLEDHGRVQGTSSDALGEAGLARMQAQTTCYQASVAEAVAIYDGIIARLGPVLVRATR